MPHTKYIWDPLSDNVLMEKDDNGDTKATNTYLPDLYGDLISQRRDGKTSYYHFDGQGSTRALTDEGEDVSDTYTHTAFGAEVSKTGATKNPYRYVGEKGYYFDMETDDYYVRARSYQPNIGRWLSADPLPSINTYLYCYNQPITHVDESGLWCGELEPCCCCALDVVLDEKSVAGITKHPVFALTGSGVQFTVNVKTDWVRKIMDANAAKEKNDCELVWNERSTLGLTLTAIQKKALVDEVKRKFGKDVNVENQKPKEWHNQYKEFWFFKMFKSWRDDRKKPCPDKEETPITDAPGVWNVPRNRTKVNVLQFELMVRSAPNCECPDKEKALYLEAFVRMKKGVPVWQLDYLKKKPEKIPEKDYTKL